MKKKSVILCVLAAIFSFSFCMTAFAGVSIPEPSEQTGGELAETAQIILGIIQWIGLVIAVAMVLYVGIKYLTSTAGKKAEAKETMVPVLIGAALLAIAPTIVSWIFTAAGGE
jgi:uncharacterized membrane protein